MMCIRNTFCGTHPFCFICFSTFSFTFPGRLDNEYFDNWCNQHNFNTSLPEEYPDIQSVSATICSQTKNIFGQAEVVLAPNYIIVETIDYIILGIFAIEVFIKIFAEGMAPWNYWFGSDWKWNNFDFIIVVLCLPVWGDSFGGSSVALLRLMRLMRVMKLPFFLWRSAKFADIL